MYATCGATPTPLAEMRRRWIAGGGGARRRDAGASRLAERLEVERAPLGPGQPVRRVGGEQVLLDELAQRPVDDSCRAQSTATSGQLLRPADGASEREREQRAERGWMDRREDETRREEERRRRPRARRVGCPARPGRAARPRQRAARASRRSRRARPTPTEGPRDGNGPCNASNRQSSARAPHSSAAEGPSSNLATSRSTSLHLAASRYISHGGTISSMRRASVTSGAHARRHRLTSRSSGA